MGRLFYLLFGLGLIAAPVSAQSGQNASMATSMATRQGLLFPKTTGGGLDLKTCTSRVVSSMRNLGYQVTYTDAGANGQTSSAEGLTKQKLIVSVMCNKPGQEIFMSVFGPSSAVKSIDTTLVQLGDEITKVWLAQK